MNSNDIRQLIEQSLSNEDRSGFTADLIAQHRPNLTQAQKNDVLSFMISYVAETPDLLDTAYQIASEQGIGTEIQTIFNTLFNYWAEKHDFIPDNLGLIGIVDDAYLSRMLIESVSTLHAQQTGKTLISIDLGPANRLMRELIGEPTASQLDGLVSQAVASQQIQSSLQGLMNFGQINFPLGNLGSYTTSQMEIDRAVDVQLGAMGIF